MQAKTLLVRLETALFTALLLSVSACAETRGDAPEPLTVEPVQITESAWYFRGKAGMASRANQGFMSNAGFVVTPDGVVVFDALASPALGEAMLRAIASVTDQPVKHLILSHYHADHVYGAQAFQAAGATVWAHAAGQAYIESDSAAERLAQRREALAPWVDENTRLVAADHWIEPTAGEPETLELGGMRFEIMTAAGAHSPSDLMLWVPGESLLFAGDVYATGRLPFVVDGDSAKWLKTIGRIAEATPTQVVPGHGRASENASRDVQLTQRYISYLRERMGAAAEELKSFEEAYAETDWSEYESMPAFDESNRRNAYSVFLEMQDASFGDDGF